MCLNFSGFCSQPEKSQWNRYIRLSLTEPFNYRWFTFIRWSKTQDPKPRQDKWRGEEKFSGGQDTQVTFSRSALTSCSCRCFLVWYGFASRASKFASPAPAEKLISQPWSNTCTVHMARIAEVQHMWHQWQRHCGSSKVFHRLWKSFEKSYVVWLAQICFPGFCPSIIPIQKLLMWKNSSW